MNKTEVFEEEILLYWLPYQLLLMFCFSGEVFLYSQVMEIFPCGVSFIFKSKIYPELIFF